MGKSYYPRDEEGTFRHRKKAEEKLGRSIRFDEEVHHINGYLWNWRWDNLIVINKTDHRAFHRVLKKIKECTGKYPIWKKHIK